jgi:hypothetical protein
MSIEIVRFERYTKQYELEGIGIFNLLPPTMQVEDRGRKSFKKLIEVLNSKENQRTVKSAIKKSSATGGTDSVEISKLLELIDGGDEKMIKLRLEILTAEIDFLKSILEGDIDKLTVENLRQDFLLKVMNDFFSYFQLSQTKPMR